MSHVHWHRGEALKAYPEFDEPLCGKLDENEARDLLLRGAEDVPPNSVTLLSVNPRFVEAFLVGANHEMARELLWREYPAELRGTFFRRFWNTGRPTDEAPRPDIEPIHTWQGELGEHILPHVGKELLIVLIRGALARRFPKVDMTMRRAVWRAAGDGTNRRFPSWKHQNEDVDIDLRRPVLVGELAEDTIYRGYALSVDEAVGSEHDDTSDAGWFFLIQEQAVEGRFGLDEGGTKDLGSWDDLGWGSLEESDRHVAVAANGDLKPQDAKEGDPVWGRDAAHLAAMTWQKPFRLGIHASELLPRHSAGD